MKYVNSKGVYVLEDSVRYQEISETTFRSIVLKEKKPAIVTFTGDWMGSASMLHLIMEDLSSEYKEKTYFFCVNLSKNQLSAEFGILNTATVCFFKDGEIIDQQVGLVSKNNLRKKVELFIAMLD